MSGLRIVELMRFEDISPALEERRRDLRYDARPVRTGQGDQIFLNRHDLAFVIVGRMIAHFDESIVPAAGLIPMAAQVDSIQCQKLSA